MTYKALVPVKSLAAAKSRLAPYLTQSQRETLVLDMLHHVLRVLIDSELMEEVFVVSPDMRVLEQTEAWGAEALIEERHDHNGSLYAAAYSLKTADTTTLLTISADLPLLQTCDIQTIVEQSKQYPIVLAPSRDGTGTNAILMRPPLALPYLFGLHSLQRHLQAARQRNLSSIICNSIGLAFDVDTIDDLDNLYELQAFSGETQLYETCSF